MITRIHRKNQWIQGAASASLLLLLGACGELSGDVVPPTDGGANSTGSTLQVASQAYCQLDDQCGEGLHCFQGLCTWECDDDDVCPSGSSCSPRGRCVLPTASTGLPGNWGTSARTIDQSRYAAISAPTKLFVTEAPPSFIAVAPGTREIQFTIELNEAPPEGTLAYAFALNDTNEVTRVQHAHSDGTRFELTMEIPDLDSLGTSVFQATLLTASERIHFMVGRAYPLQGLYTGVFEPFEVYGAKIPLALNIETSPANATSFEEADEAWVWLPTTTADFIGVPNTGAEAWTKSPVQYDANSQSWYARFATSVPTDFGGELTDSGQVKRSIRIELSNYDPQTGALSAMIADRWNGLFDLRTQQGARELGHATLNGGASLVRSAERLEVDASNNAGTLTTSLLPVTNDLSMCDAEVWSIFASELACEHVVSESAFNNSPATTRATCALLVHDSVMLGETLRDRILAFLDPEQANPEGLSFQEFLSRCASSSHAECVPSPRALCARNMMASAYRNVDATSDLLEQLNEALMEISSELFAGTKFAAFHVDTDSRLKWLRSSEAPLFLASTLREYNQQILDTWKTSVVDPHVQTLVSMMDPAGLDVLTRATADPASRDTRQYLLQEAITSWEAAADALELLIRRHHLLETQTHRRRAVAATLLPTAQVLYISAVQIQQLAHNNGLSSLAMGIGPRLSTLILAQGALNKSFNDLLFARDATVITSTSLDPQSSSRSLLRELEAAAHQSIRNAAATVDRALDEAIVNELSTEVLAARYEDQILAVRDELINLCGLREGCNAQDTTRDPLCAVATGPGECGIQLRRGQDPAEVDLHAQNLSASRAGSAISDLLLAASAVAEAEIKAENAGKRVGLAAQEFTVFSETIAQRQERRRSNEAQIRRLFDEVVQLVSAAEQESLALIQSRRAQRELVYDEFAVEIEEWATVRTTGATLRMEQLGKITSYRNAAESLEFSGGLVQSLAQNAASVFPGETATDPAKLIAQVFATKAKAMVVAGGMLTYVDYAANQHAEQLRGNNLALGLARGDIEDYLDEEAMLDEMKLNLEQDKRDLGVLQDKLDAINVESNAKRNTYEALIAQLEAQLEIDLANEREAFELIERRNTVLREMTNVDTQIYQLEQAKLTWQQRLNNYYEQVQTAALLQARLDAMMGRWSNISQILGSPHVVFSFANRLELAEQRINVARQALEEWVVALEYYAVRPFLEQRSAIMLARNPQQLEAIANELARLQSVCGGPVTQEKLDVSLRDNLLGLNYSAPDNEGRIQTPGARLRALLERADTTSGRQIRLTSTETLGDRLSRGNALATYFTISNEVFANLPLTCNAKISGIGVQLVGLEAKDVHPVVTIIYDGSAELRSCQADIRQIVSAQGAERTAFDEVTRFQTGGRAISPVAGVGSYGPQANWNSTLEGTPLAAGYSVLIDLEHPANQNIDWNLLEDIRLMFHYNYQDMFPEGQCE